MSAARYEAAGAPRRVLILGGYGAFGARVAERLARIPSVELTIAGRLRDKAEAFAASLVQRTGIGAIPAVLDGGRISAADLQPRKPAVLINASGPFQRHDYTVARACVSAGVHYVDLADASTFVAEIDTLNDEAKRADVLIVSGASTVPAVSGAVVDKFAPEFKRLDTVETIISPGNSFSLGLSTTQSILGNLGRPIAAASEGALYGWQGLRRQRLPGLGGRWIGHCDAPDRELFARRYPGLKSAHVYAALEVGTFHSACGAFPVWCVRACCASRSGWRRRCWH